MVTEPQPVTPPTVPPPTPPDFEEMIKEWEEKAKGYMEQAQQSEVQLQQLGLEYEQLVQPPSLWRRIIQVGQIITMPQSVVPATLLERNRLKRAITDVEIELERQDFYARLYYQAPMAIMGRKVANADEVLALLQPPQNITSTELEEITNLIDSMFDVIVRPLPEMALEAEALELPGLVAPPTVVEVPPNTIQKLTIDAIVRQLTAPEIPPSVMTEEEWTDFMVKSGQISDKADLESYEYLESEASRIVDEWQERNNMLEAYRTGIAELPDYELVDFLKELVVMPGMALLQVGQMYFEHVSQPLAGLVYGPFIPDLDAAYQHYRQTEGTWQALSHAWEEWDAPGEGAGEWILKYMLMEGLVDPLMYVGWGLATRITKPLGSFGRLVRYSERGIAEVLELPFDLIKIGLRKIPKTVGQQATLKMAKSGQYVDKYMTQRFGKALYQMTMEEWTDGVQFAVRHTLNNPQVDDVITRAGKELMDHTPMTRKQVWDWAQRLETTLRPEDITKHTVDSVDQLFETFLRHSGFKKKLIVPKEASDELVRTLFGRQTDDISTVASKLLLERRSSILASARSFGQVKTPFQAVRQLMRRNYDNYIATEASEVALAKIEMGRISTLLTDAPARIQKVWAASIDRWIVRPFAQSYLTFALYGPMNVIEDVIRTALGGVIPGRKAPQTFMRKWAGVSYDREILRDAASETLGFMTLQSPHELNNWILQLGGLAKGFGSKTYRALVEYPGQIGISIRRHFLDARATQILKEMGGESFENLARAGPDKLMGVTDKKIIKEVQQAAMELKIQGASREAFNAAKGDFTRAKIIRREVDNILKEHPDLPTPVRDFLMRQQDEGIIFREGGESINRVVREADNVLIDDFIASPERASAQYEQLADFLTQLEVRNPQEMAQLIQSLNLMSSVAGATPKQILARATVRTRGLALGERKVSMDKALDSISIFRERANASMDRVVEKIRLAYREAPEQLAISPEYITKADHLFNLQAAKRLRSSELGENINAWRHEWFAVADPSDIRSEAFWDDFYRESSQRWSEFNVEMADFDGMIKSAIDDLDVAGGIRRPQRPPLKIVDRELAPQDVAQLMGMRGDDITRSMLDVMTAQNDRDMFVAYVMAHVRQGDVGFNKQSVGTVYDQMVNSLQIRPENMSWVSGKRLELEAVRHDLHTLYNSKLLPDEEVVAIGKYFDDTADAVEDLMFREAPAPRVRFERRVTQETGEGFLLEGKPITVTDYQISDAAGLDIGRVRIRESDTEFIIAGIETTRRIRATGMVEDIIRETILEPSKGKRLYAMSLSDKAERILSGGQKRGWLRYAPLDPEAPRGVQVIDVLKVPPERRVPPVELRPEYVNYNDLRQSAMDEAHKWYYKEFTDYTNANAFDAMLKAIYPFWTYESQRWFWLPRSFVRHPGTFTAFERWQDNTDYGYIHIPGTSVDIGFGRGTIYGTLQTRLARRDYPEYYDSLGVAGGVIEFSDFLSRYGFYPGAHIGIPMALFFGGQTQMGEITPALIKTPLDALIAIFPDSENVKWISDHLFADRFRHYMTILTVNRMGGDGSLIFSKMQERQPLTPEEEQIWADARREMGWYSAGFEQFGLFRMRTDEQHQMYEMAGKVIEEMTGFTSEQQDWIRKHGYRLWDLVGGMSPTEQAILQEMDYYRWVGNIRPLLPGKEQEVLNQVELGWNQVEKYTDGVLRNKLQLQQEFLSGARGPDDYNAMLLEIYDKQGDYILSQMEDNLLVPLPEGLTDEERKAWIETHSLMTLEGRKEYYKDSLKPMPVLHPMRELLNLFFSIELRETTNPETGEIERDWDNFWAMRQAIEDAVPDHLKQEWEDYLARNSTRLEQIRREVYHNYFRTYNKVWEKILSTYSEQEQGLIEEYLALERTGRQLERQAVIKATISERTGNMLISSFRSEVSDAKQAFRYHNPQLDAWLYFWGKTSTFVSPTGEDVYRQLAIQTGRKI